LVFLQFCCNDALKCYVIGNVFKVYILREY